MKNKGFTLIEILAVIIILGIVMMIAIPNITNNIMDSKRKSYLVDAQRYCESARNVVETNKIPCPNRDTTYYIPRVCLPVEKGQKSPYADWKDLYVAVTYNGLKHNYYFVSLDDAGYAIDLTPVDKLTEDSIKHKTPKKDPATNKPVPLSVNLNVAVGSRDKIKVYNSDCATTVSKEVKTVISDN